MTPEVPKIETDVREERIREFGRTVEASTAELVRTAALDCPEVHQAIDESPEIFKEIFLKTDDLGSLETCLARALPRSAVPKLSAQMEEKFQSTVDNVISTAAQEETRTSPVDKGSSEVIVTAQFVEGRGKAFFQDLIDRTKEDE